MNRLYETDKGIVVIGEYFVLINNTIYDICSEQQSIGEYEYWDVQNIEAYTITDTTTGQSYYLEVFYHKDTLPDETCYSYRLSAID